MNVRDLYHLLATLPADAEVQVFVDSAEVPYGPTPANSVDVAGPAGAEIVYIGAVP